MKRFLRSVAGEIASAILLIITTQPFMEIDPSLIIIFQIFSDESGAINCSRAEVVLQLIFDFLLLELSAFLMARFTTKDLVL